MRVMQAEDHLKRIGYTGSREPSAETLRQLHRAHMFSVSFENLDIPLAHMFHKFLDPVEIGGQKGGFEAQTG